MRLATKHTIYCNKTGRVTWGKRTRWIRCLCMFHRRSSLNSVVLWVDLKQACMYREAYVILFTDFLICFLSVPTEVLYCVTNYIRAVWSMTIFGEIIKVSVVQVETLTPVNHSFDLKCFVLFYFGVRG